MPRSCGELSPTPFRSCISYGMYDEDGDFDEMEEPMNRSQNFTNDDRARGSTSIRHILELDDDDDDDDDIDDDDIDDDDNDDDNDHDNDDYDDDNDDESVGFENNFHDVEVAFYHLSNDLRRLSRFWSFSPSISSSSPSSSSPDSRTTTSSSFTLSPPSHLSSSPSLYERMTGMHPTQPDSPPHCLPSSRSLRSPDLSYPRSLLLLPPLPSSSNSSYPSTNSSFFFHSNSHSEPSHFVPNLNPISNSSSIQRPRTFPVCEFVVQSSLSPPEQSSLYSSSSSFASNSLPTTSTSASNSTSEFLSSSPTQIPFTQLNDVLTCFICFGALSKAVMCPHCSKLGCYNCLRKWMTKHHSSCPHCRASLQLSQLIPCRFIEDLQQSMKDLVTSQQSKQTHSFNDVCSTHNKALYYYCEECEEPICPDCAMFESNHQGHTFSHLDKLCQSKITQLQAECENLVTKMSVFKALMKKVDNELGSLNFSKCRIQNSVEQMMLKRKRKFETELKEKQQQIQAFKSSIEIQLNQLKKVYDSIQYAISNYPQSKLVKELSSLHQQIETCSTTPPIYNFTPLIFKNDFEIPDFVGSPTITIPHLSNFSKGDFFISEVVWVSGAPWRLKVYPLGNLKSQKHVSIFLEKVVPETQVDVALYDIYFVNLLLSSSNKIEFTTSFSYNKAMGSSHAFSLTSPSSVSSSSLSSKLPSDSNQDSFNLQFFIRPQTYHQKTLDLESYVQWLQSPTSLPQVRDDLEEIDLVPKL